VENCEKKIIRIGKFSFKNAKFGLTSPILGKFRRKIEISSSHNLICQKFAKLCLSENCNFLPRLVVQLTTPLTVGDSATLTFDQ